MEARAFKAKQLRYKKPISRNLNLDSIKQDLWDMQDKCSDIHWYDNDEESLVNALDGDEDDAYEFRMAFCDLEPDLDRFREELEDTYVSDYFDTFFPEDMSPQEVIDSINEAYDDRMHRSGNTYYGKTNEGLEITMYLDHDEKIISAFPKYKGDK